MTKKDVSVASTKKLEARLVQLGGGEYTDDIENEIDWILDELAKRRERIDGSYQSAGFGFTEDGPFQM